MADHFINYLFSPQKSSVRLAWKGILFLLFLSFLALLAAPLIMPDGYSWIIHTTSESAAQGLQGAWLARLGFLLFGLAVLWLSNAAWQTWGRSAEWMHIGFGVMMVGTAAFSHQPFKADVPFDVVEDALHSFTATLMGFAFSLGVFIPLMMLRLPAIGGLVQRLMFLVAYLWYGMEAWGLRIYKNSVQSG